MCECRSRQMELGGTGPPPPPMVLFNRVEPSRGFIGSRSIDGVSPILPTDSSLVGVAAAAPPPPPPATAGSVSVEAACFGEERAAVDLPVQNDAVVAVTGRGDPTRDILPTPGCCCCLLRPRGVVWFCVYCCLSGVAVRCKSVDAVDVDFCPLVALVCAKRDFLPGTSFLRWCGVSWGRLVVEALCGDGAMAAVDVDSVMVWRGVLLQLLLLL
jgi:hypothetical protein